LRADDSIIKYEDDGGVLKPGDGANLLSERAQKALVPRSFAREELDRDWHSLSSVDPTPHLSHTPTSDRGLQIERAEGDHGCGFQLSRRGANTVLRVVTQYAPSTGL